MKLKEMIFNDYRQFYGKQTLRFASGSEMNITLINGANGAGKTNLLEAITWCLYGEYDQKRGAIVSKEKAFSAKFGDELECSVSIWYTHEGSEYVVIRKGRARKIKHTILENHSEQEEIVKYKSFALEMLPAREEDFKVLENKESGMRYVSDPTITIDRALPQNARQYFLFDGEKIDQLSKPEHDAEVREAVRNVLQLPTIERAIDHLKTVKQDFLKKAKDVAKKGAEEELFKAIEEVDKAMEEAKKAYGECSEKLLQVKELKARIDQDLKRFSSIKELTSRRDDLQKAYDLCQNRKTESKNRLAELLGNSHLIICKKLVEDSMQLLEERREKGQIPPGIRETFIKDLIEKGRCICGNDLCEGTEGRALIEKFLVESRTSTRVAEEVSDVMIDLNQVKHTAIEIAKNLKITLSDWMHSIDELDDIAARFEDVHSQIKKMGDTDITKLEKSRKEYENEERELIREQKEIEIKIRGFKAYMQDFAKELQRITKTKSASGEIARITKLTEMAVNVFQTVFEEFAQKKRMEIEKQLKSIFYRLIWKKDQFPDVRLTENYSLELYDKYGAPAREELSAGERQILSLSFITAMAFVTGGMIPLVMDTPFGRLFSEHRANIGREIPRLTNQWVLLVQDEEISKETLEILMPRVGSQYQLTFSDGCTTLEEV